MAQAVVCIVQSEITAQNIVDDLRTSGFSGNDISVLFPDRTGTRDFAHEKGTKAPEGAAAGVTTGGVLGGAAGWLVGIGALAIPGMGPFIAAGPIMAALGGAGLLFGPLVGALILVPLEEISPWMIAATFLASLPVALLMVADAPETVRETGPV